MASLNKMKGVKQMAEQFDERKELGMEIQMALLNQLKEKGVKSLVFKDLVSDYMTLWDIKCLLIDDIFEKGVTLKYQNGENQYGYKKNESVSELNRINSQMLKILKELNITAEPIKKKEEDFEL